jgi:hypothetical protein
MGAGRNGLSISENCEPVGVYADTGDIPEYEMLLIKKHYRCGPK